jgi:hypothetical protein
MEAAIPLEEDAMKKQRQSPRAILILHNDMSERVGRLLTTSLSAWYPAMHRNIRWGYNPDYYFMVVCVGNEKLKSKIPRSAKTIMYYEYVPYTEYIKETKGSISIEAYQEQAARTISKDIIERLK